MKNNRIKELFLLLTALSLFAVCCKGKKQQENGDLSSLANSTVLTVNSEKIDYREAMLYLNAAIQECTALYGNQVEDYVLSEDGTTFGELVQKKTLELMTFQKLVASQGKRLSIELDSEEKKAVYDRVEEYMQKADYSALARFGIARKNVEQIYLDTALTQKIYDSVTLNVDTDISDEEAGIKHFQSLVLHSYQVDENGIRGKLSVSQLLKTLDRYDSLYAEAQSTLDFYSLAFANTDDRQYLDFYASQEELPDFFKESYSLNVGEAVQIRTEDSFYILYCVSVNEEEAVRKRKEELITERQDSEFQKQYELWKAEASIILNEPVFDEICEEMRNNPGRN